MLPDLRADEYLYSIPKYEIKAIDVKGFMDEYQGFHQVFEDCFYRSESRFHFYQYMAGQFSELERKSIEPIALNIKNGNVRAMQRFVSDAEWNDEKIMNKYRNMVYDDLGDKNGAIIFDETSFVKKGNDSVGVSKQYCGSIGKVENGQVGVFAAYASLKGYSLVDKRLFIPEKWFTDDYAPRRNKCKVPEDLIFKSKPQLAVDIFKDIVEENILPFRYVLADSIYGNSPEFIEAIDLPNITYLVSMPSDTLCWLKTPVVRKKTYKYAGEIKAKTILEQTEKKPISFCKFAKNLNSYFWYRRKVSEGTKGPIEYEFTKRRVVLSKDGIPNKTVWLIVKRTIGDSPEYSFYISNALLSTKLETFVWLSGIRWAIEQSFEETKTELGMDQYEVRKFRGWHHHILTCMLGHFFLWHLKIKLGKKSTSYYALAA
ncbi:MAG: IS701 family transposase [Desulfamplus sp.]|nr:IS701 family transposase [Desulfamplus sp.]